jgi:imidazolonepropionase-like amidohydrolase
VSLEAVRLWEYGLGARESVEAAGPNAYGYLGLAALEVGASADLLLFDTDPTEDVDVLTRPVAGIRCGEVVFDHPRVFADWRAV